MQYYSYTTKQGDRLDLIALAHYNDQMRVQEIFQENYAALRSPKIPAILPEGMVLKIPVLEVSQNRSSVGLPPWKRSSTYPAK
ncbi:MAG: tail protein X [Cyanobacteria bacterium SBLK]|nr:tail protein X [Cyanobacteria bacterium SBLK]